MLHKFDTWLLEKFECFSHWWQRMFGQDCFWWAKIALVISVMGIAIGAFIDMGWISSVIMVILFGLFLFLHFRFNFKPIVSKAREDSLLGLANKSRLDDVYPRLMVLIVAFLLYSLNFSVTIINKGAGFEAYPAFGFIMVFSFISAHYFVACDPLPPVKSKMRQKLESLIGRVKEVFTPTPVLEPVPATTPSR